MTAQRDMKSNILSLYGINQHLSQMGRDFCWLDMATRWELGYESVAGSLFIANKIDTNPNTFSHLQRCKSKTSLWK